MLRSLAGVFRSLAGILAITQEAFQIYFMSEIEVLALFQVLKLIKSSSSGRSSLALLSFTLYILLVKSKILGTTLVTSHN
jgi:hypothetical protein